MPTYYKAFEAAGSQLPFRCPISGRAGISVAAREPSLAATPRNRNRSRPIRNPRLSPAGRTDKKSGRLLPLPGKLCTHFLASPPLKSVEHPAPLLATADPETIHDPGPAGPIRTPSVGLARCFLRLADLPSFALDRLNRYEAALWRQVAQTLFALDALDRCKPGRTKEAILHARKFSDARRIEARHVISGPHPAYRSSVVSIDKTALVCKLARSAAMRRRPAGRACATPRGDMHTERSQ